MIPHVLVRLGRAAWARPLVILACLALHPAQGADDRPTLPAANPASEALNRTAAEVAAAQPSPDSPTRQRLRASQLMGAVVHGTGGEPLGEVVDVELRNDGPIIVIRNGRIATRLVAIPAGDLRWLNRRFVLPGATEESLRSRPPFEFERPDR